MRALALLLCVARLLPAAAGPSGPLAQPSACPVPEPPAAVRGSMLLQMKTSNRQRNASALQELLPPRPGGVLAGAAEAAVLPTEWWDPALTKAPIYVEPRWGLSNRLRTIAGAFVAGRRVGRNVVVIWNTGPQCPQELGELFQGVASAPSAPAGARLLQHGRLCEFRAETPLALEQVPPDQPISVVACDFSVKSLLDQRHLAFHAMHLQPALRAEVASLVEQLRRPGRRAVGVHIRQGSLQDARQGSFFGKFKRPPVSVTEMPCCTEQSPQWVCPQKAHPLHEYVGAMRKQAGGNGAAVFFVAADRPACIGSLKQQPGYVNIVHSRLPAAHRGSNNATAALADMYALAACEEMLYKDPGSWSGLVHSIHQGFKALP